MKVFIVTTKEERSPVTDIVRVFDTYDKAYDFMKELIELCHKGIKLTEREVQ